MKITFGKYKGRLLEEIILVDPRYIGWMLDVEKPDWKLRHLIEEVSRLAGIFDQKPMIHNCAECGKPATKLSIAEKGYEIRYWCDSCTPKALGGYGMKVDVVRDYVSALNLELDSPAEYFQPDPPLHALAYAKGLRKRASEGELEAFYNNGASTGLGRLPGSRSL
jgi:hypothetical protein